MSYLAANITPRARLFEFLRQEDVAQRRVAPKSKQVTPDVILAFQQDALRSLDRRAG